ncbi:thioredoxin domain-containing protein 8 isoform X1 [Piliocolobus tephrosceles]|uniref:Thioredoxin domain-containing protein 8 n=1 Tax=Piliocolobus tephrosceles TaxID=591936 RepID=A0A8C9IDF2_9PRIM|nr:thioredoxin domain-containing protein 8 isoform X1 [Piliocolobus tephrosceles]
MVQIINDMNEFKTFLTAAGHKLAVVEFSSKWCGPCKRMVPVFHAMSVKYQNVFFANVDVNNSPELAETCHIKTIPTFQMFKKSQKVTLFSRIKRMICCYRSGFTSNPIFEFSGADAKQLEAKIQELM